MTHLVCGEALYDVFLGEARPRGFTLDARFGGSAFNAAIALARLGRPAALVTGISADPMGDRLVAELAHQGVATDRLIRPEKRGALALVALSETGGASYSFYGEDAADRAVTEADLPSLEGATSVMLGCFSILTQPTGDSFLTLARRARGGPLVTLDPNVRATAEPDIGAWRARIELFAESADLIKISDEDMRLLGLDPEESARRWLDGGARLVAMTRGGEGAVGWIGAERVEVPAPRIKVADTVGAGDSFIAALMAAFDEMGVAARPAFDELTPAQATRALDFASQAAAVTCSRRGANPPRRDELPPL